MYEKYYKSSKILRLQCLKQLYLAEYHFVGAYACQRSCSSFHSNGDVLPYTSLPEPSTYSMKLLRACKEALEDCHKAHDIEVGLIKICVHSEERFVLW